MLLPMFWFMLDQRVIWVSCRWFWGKMPVNNGTERWLALGVNHVLQIHLIWADSKSSRYFVFKQNTGSTITKTTELKQHSQQSCWLAEISLHRIQWVTPTFYVRKLSHKACEQEETQPKKKLQSLQTCDFCSSITSKRGMQYPDDMTEILKWPLNICTIWWTWRCFSFFSTGLLELKRC